MLHDILRVLMQGDGTQILYTDDKESPPYRKVVDERTNETVFKFSSHLYALTNKGELMISATKTFTQKGLEPNKDYTEDEVEDSPRVNIGVVVRSSLTEHNEDKANNVKGAIRSELLKYIGKHYQSTQVVRINIALLNNLPNKGSVIQ